MIHKGGGKYVFEYLTHVFVFPIKDRIDRNQLWTLSEFYIGRMNRDAMSSTFFVHCTLHGVNLHITLHFRSIFARYRSHSLKIFLSLGIA